MNKIMHQDGRRYVELEDHLGSDWRVVNLARQMGLIDPLQPNDVTLTQLIHNQRLDAFREISLVFHLKITPASEAWLFGAPCATQVDEVWFRWDIRFANLMGWIGLVRRVEAPEEIRWISQSCVELLRPLYPMTLALWEKS